MAENFSGREFLWTFGLVFAAIGALFSVDTFLAKMERAETRTEAARLVDEGKRLMARGDYLHAIDRFKDALVTERSNREYARTLAEAQLQAGKSEDAEQTLTDLLQRDSTDGPANLLMARVLVKEERLGEAFSYYHRAIYGHWRQDAQANELRVRFELIDLLAARGAKEELLAELLPVQDLAPRDVKTRFRLGQLFLAAGSGNRAADVFRVIVREQPTNADARIGLADSEFATGDYRDARNDYQAALHLKPADDAVRKRLELSTDVLARDPTIRGLGPNQRFRRSLMLLRQTLDEATNCLPQPPDPAAQALLDSAAQALAERVPAIREAEAAESDVDLAEKLWQVRKKSCGTPPSPDSPLTLVLAKMAQ